MNEITVLIYFICFAVVFGATFAFMWRMMTITLKDFDRVKNVHPELRDIKPGEELLVFQVKEEKDQNNKKSSLIKNNDGVAIVEGTPAASLVKDVDKFFAAKPRERMAGENIAQKRTLDPRAINIRRPTSKDLEQMNNPPNVSPEDNRMFMGGSKDFDERTGRVESGYRDSPKVTATREKQMEER